MRRKEIFKRCIANTTFESQLDGAITTCMKEEQKRKQNGKEREEGLIITVEYNLNLNCKLT